MRILIIDDAAKESIAKVKAYAEAHPFNLAQLAAVVDGNLPCAGCNESFCCYLKDGFRVVYSIEEQEPGTIAHLSVSVNSPDKLPSIPAMELIVEAFGMGKNILEMENVFLDRANNAVNVLKIIKLAPQF